jgi:hypothetical protein
LPKVKTLIQLERNILMTRETIRGVSVHSKRLLSNKASAR